MSSAARESGVSSEQGEVTDGFHLLIDALKLNGIETIYNVPGIPITDLVGTRRRRDCGSFPSDMNNMRATRRPWQGI